MVRFMTNVFEKMFFPFQANCLNYLLFNPSCIMSQIGQTHFKNLAANANAQDF